MENFKQKKKEEIDFNRQVLTLFLLFFKKEKLFDGLYSKDNANYLDRLCRMFKQGNIDPGNIWIHYGADFNNNPLRKRKSNLVLSQLWRFFLLDNISLINFKTVRDKTLFKVRIEGLIMANGTRDDEDIVKCFKKHHFALVS